MKSLSLVSIAAVAFATFGCDRHDTPIPNGVNQRVEIPADIANVLPADAFPSALRTASDCQNGDVTSCNRLAGWLAYGKDVPKYEQSVDNDAHKDVNLEADSDHHDAEAEHVEADQHAAADEHGDEATAPDSEHEVAHDEVHGHSYVGIQPNPEAAAPLFQIACNGGVQDACVELVTLSADGHGDLSNDQRAELLQNACRENAFRGCLLGAQLSADGKASISPAAASADVERACQAFYEPACRYLRSTDDRATPLPGDNFNFQFETVKNDTGITIRAILPSQGVAGQVRTTASDVFSGTQVQTDFHIDSAMLDTSWVQTIPSLLVMQRELTDASSTVRLDKTTLTIAGGSPQNPTFLTTLIRQVSPQLHGRQVEVQLGNDDTDGMPVEEEVVQ